MANNEKQLYLIPDAELSRIEKAGIKVKAITEQVIDKTKETAAKAKDTTVSDIYDTGKSIAKDKRVQGVAIGALGTVLLSHLLNL